MKKIFLLLSLFISCLCFSQNISYSSGLPSVKFRAYPSGNQTITSGPDQKVIFDLETFDTNNNFASNRFTPTVAGYYHINSSVYVNQVAGVVTCRVYIFKNSAQYSRFERAGTLSAESLTYKISDIVYMNGSTDYLEIYFFQNSGSNLTLSAGSIITFFEGFLIN